jgi:muconolactone delta-isomerase
MDFLVTMTTQVLPGTSDEAVAEVRTREAAHSSDLARQGSLLRLWRPPLEPGEWRTLGLFSAADGDELEETLASMPLRIWRTDEVTPLAPHPNDPAPELRGPRGLLPEFLTIFTVRIPAGAAPESVDEMTEREAVRTRDLAGQGALARLWLLPVTDGPTRALGLWRAVDEEQMQKILDSLPMAGWLTVDTIPLSAHPSDPAVASSWSTHADGRALMPPLTGQRVVPRPYRCWTPVRTSLSSAGVTSRPIISRRCGGFRRRNGPRKFRHDGTFSR